MSPQRLRILVSNDARTAQTNAQPGARAVLVTDITNYRSIQLKGVVVLGARPDGRRHGAGAPSIDTFCEAGPKVGLTRRRPASSQWTWSRSFSTWTTCTTRRRARRRSKDCGNDDRRPTDIARASKHHSVDHRDHSGAGSPTSPTSRRSSGRRSARRDVEPVLSQDHRKSSENPLAMMCLDDRHEHLQAARAARGHAARALFDAARADRRHRRTHRDERCVRIEVDGRLRVEHRGSATAPCSAVVAARARGPRLPAPRRSARLDHGVGGRDRHIAREHRRSARSPELAAARLPTGARSAGDIGKPRLRLRWRRLRSRPGGRSDRHGCCTAVRDAHRQPPEDVVLRQNGAARDQRHDR